MSTTDQDEEGNGPVEPQHDEDSRVEVELDLVGDALELVFECVSCNQRETIRLADKASEADMQLAYEKAQEQHTCQPREAKVPSEESNCYILTDSEVTAVIVDPAIVGLFPFFASQQEALMTAQPYRARVWKLEEVE